jgi:hypothetical protein
MKKTIFMLCGTVLAIGMLVSAANPKQVRQAAKDGPLCIPHVNCLK